MPGKDVKTMNRVILMGRLTKNPEIKYAGKDNDMAVARYTPVSYTHLTLPTNSRV